MTNESIINVIRNYWRFDHRQQHTHTWYDREDFIRHHLVPLAARIAELEAEVARLKAAPPISVATIAGYELGHADAEAAAKGDS